MSSVRRSIALATASHYAAQVIGISSIMLLSRLLTPQEIGVFSIGTAVLSLIHVFRDFGISSYLIREPALSRDKVGTCYVVSAAIAWTSGLLLLLATPAIARLYEVPGLTSVLYVLICGLFIVPINSVRMALLRRDMRFDVLLWTEIASALANAATAITLAWLGFGFVSLAWGGLASLVATILVTTFCRATPHPARFTVREWRSVCSFGGMALTLNLIIRGASQAPMLVVGKLVDLHATGLLSRAMGLTDLLVSVAQQSLGNAIFAGVARKVREGREIASDYIQAVTYLAAVAVPAAVYLMLMAKPVLHVMFGENWEAAETLVRIFCVATVFLPFTVFNGSFLTASGRIDQQLRIEAMFSPLKAGVWFLAAPFDLPTAACCYVAIHIASLATSTVAVSRVVGARLSAVVSSMIQVAPLALCTVAPALLLMAAGNEWLITRPPLSLAVSAITGGLAWCLALFALRHPLTDEVRRALRNVQALLTTRRAG